MRRTAVVVSIIASTFGAACTTQPECSPNPTMYTATVDGKGLDDASVARFDLAQNYLNYGPVGCKGEPFEKVGNVELTVTSTAQVPLTFKYEVQGLNAGGTMVWSYTDSIPRLGPGDMIEVGKVTTTSTRLENGARVFLTGVTQVP